MIQLAEPPRSRDIYLWADYVELLAVTNTDGIVSRSDLLGRLSASADLVGQPEGPWEDAGNGIEAPAGNTPTVQRQDRQQLLVADVFEHLAYRMATLGHAYPFKLRAGRAALSKKRITIQHHVYLFFLLASNLPRLDRRWYPTITRHFERAVAEALRVWLAPSAEVHIFGTSAPSRSRYRGSLFDKLTRLSEDLSENLLLTSEDVRRGDVGDAGADVVAWIAFGDNASSRLVILAQAACGLDWVTKQHASGSETWRQIIQFTAPHANVVAIPHFFRRSSGEWAWRRSIHGSILVDRQRLVWLFRHSQPALPTTAIDELLATRQAAV